MSLGADRCHYLCCGSPGPPLSAVSLRSMFRGGGFFWLNGPCDPFAGLCFVIGWPNQTLVSSTAEQHEKWYEFDGISAMLLLAASVLVVLGIQQAGNGSYAWSQWICDSSSGRGLIMLDSSHLVGNITSSKRGDSGLRLFSHLNSLLFIGPCLRGYYRRFLPDSSCI